MKFSRLLVIASLILFPTFVWADSNCPDLTTLQVWAGYLSWMGLLKTCGVVVGAVGFVIFFKGFIAKFWDVFWQCIRDFADIIAHAVSIGLIISGIWIPQQYQLWPVLGGCLLFGASVFFTIMLRNIKGDNPSVVYGILFLVWSLVAIYFKMSEVGFIAVAALMGVLGFSVGVDPFCYSFGFRSDEKGVIVQGTSAALMILVFYGVIHLLVPEAPDALKIFMPGVFWLGSFVGFLGLLIMSNKWYVADAKLSYGWMQFVTLLTYCAVLTYGMIAGVNPLAGMAGTFLVFYFPAKLIEVETKDMMAFGIKLMSIAFFLFGVWFFAMKYQPFIKPYLTTILPA